MRAFAPCLILTALLSVIRAAEPADCHCDPAIVVSGDLVFQSLPAGVAIAGADHPADFAIAAVAPAFEVTVTGLAAGDYTVELILAETVHHAAGERLINVNRGWRSPILVSFDIFREAGGFARAAVLRCPVAFTAAPAGGPLMLRFEGRKDDATFNAVRVRNAAGAVVATITAAALLEADLPTAAQVPAVREALIYRDPAQPEDRRIDDLIRRMSLRERTGQILNSAPAIPRLGVPAYNYWNECLHGVARAGLATVFPQAIGLAAMWDPARLHAIADAIATEARAKYHDALRNHRYAQYYGLTFWTPNINLFRDPRWGRGQETYGEDPFLTGRLAVAFITGLQGDDPHHAKALACAKHYAVHSGPEPLRHTFDAVPSEQDLYDSYLPHFEAAVREGHVGAVMSAYNRIDGRPASANPFLLTELLRDRWGFDGHVVSDCDAIRDIWATHKFAATPEAAAALAVKAGCDLNCGDQYYTLTRAVKQGLLSVDDIDRALRHVLRARFRLGMFDPDQAVPYAAIPMSEVESPAHAALNLQAARESIVLLKNSGILPLNRGQLKRLAVIGANADSVPMLLGNYNGTPAHPVTILQGIKTAVGPGVDVVAAPGCPLALHPGEKPSPDAPEFRRAVELGRSADVVIYVGGLDADLEREEQAVNYEGFNGGDRTRIELPEVQLALLKALQATGRPVILVICSGSAIAVPWAAEHLPAILQAWYPGETGGTAVADVLFGNCDPGGRLPVTIYRATEDLPPFTDYAMAGRTYRFFGGTPLYPFGHGLSYTQVQYGTVRGERGADGAIRLTTEIANVGKRDGDAVVQVYAHRVGEINPRLPRERLCAFQRIALPAGGRAGVTLTVPAEALRRWDTATKRYVVDPGTYEFRVGASSTDIRETARIQVAP